MLPPDLLYEISVFLSPKDLIKLSLCSKHLRKVILSNQSIWRTQYYMEWPAFFTPRDSDKDALFPAPTWLQTFLMHKLSLLNMERQKMKEIPCEIDYQFIQELFAHYDEKARKLTVYKNMHQKTTEYNSVPIRFNLYYRIFNMPRCRDNLFVYYNVNTPELYCFSLDGGYTCTKIGMFNDIVFVDKNRFVGIKDDSVECGFKVDSNMEVQQQDVTSLSGYIFAPIRQRPGFFVLAKAGCDNLDHTIWCIYDLRQDQPKLVMTREIPTQCKVTEIRRFILADPDFIFIPFISEGCIFTYIYSFKEDRYRIIELSGRYDYRCVAVFYDSAWNSAVPCNLDRTSDIFWIYFSGTSLDFFAAAAYGTSSHVIKFIRISRKSLLIMTRYGFKVINIQSGSDIWMKKYGYYKNVGYNDRYLACDKTLYDFNPEEVPEIQEWLYKVFK